MMTKIDGTAARALQWGEPPRWRESAEPAEAYRAAQERLQTYEEQRRRQRLSYKLANKARLAYAVVWVAIVVLSILLVSRHAEIARLGYHLGELEQQAKTLAKENAEYQIEIARLQSPERIYQTATHKFGMRRPDNILVAQAPAGWQPPANGRRGAQPPVAGTPEPLLVAPAPAPAQPDGVAAAGESGGAGIRTRLAQAWQALTSGRAAEAAR